MEEERRILYVALTRAKEELYLTRVEHSDANGFVYMNPDHFLNDLPKSLVNEVIIEENDAILQDK
jgi:DNA helicase-2/ATP-dependent DNA helicase PcrA